MPYISPKKDRSDDFCGACGGAGNILCCDECPSAFHYRCCGYANEAEGPGDRPWKCWTCSNGARGFYHPDTPLQFVGENAKKKKVLVASDDILEVYYQGRAVHVTETEITNSPKETFPRTSRRLWHGSFRKTIFSHDPNDKAYLPIARITAVDRAAAQAQHVIKKISKRQDDNDSDGDDNDGDDVTENGGGGKRNGGVGPSSSSPQKRSKMSNGGGSKKSPAASQPGSCRGKGRGGSGGSRPASRAAPAAPSPTPAPAAAPAAASPATAATTGKESADNSKKRSKNNRQTQRNSLDPASYSDGFGGTGGSAAKRLKLTHDAPPDEDFEIDLLGGDSFSGPIAESLIHKAAAKAAAAAAVAGDEVEASSPLPFFTQEDGGQEGGIDGGEGEGEGHLSGQQQQSPSQDDEQYQSAPEHSHPEGEEEEEIHPVQKEAQEVNLDDAFENAAQQPEEIEEVDLLEDEVEDVLERDVEQVDAPTSAEPSEVQATQVLSDNDEDDIEGLDGEVQGIEEGSGGGYVRHEQQHQQHQQHQTQIEATPEEDLEDVEVEEMLHHEIEISPQAAEAAVPPYAADAHTAATIAAAELDIDGGPSQQPHRCVTVTALLAEEQHQQEQQQQDPASPSPLTEDGAAAILRDLLYQQPPSSSTHGAQTGALTGQHELCLTAAARSLRPDQKVEVRWLDSPGHRGAWYNAKILDIAFIAQGPSAWPHFAFVLLRYRDMMDSDGKTPLQEWRPLAVQSPFGRDKVEVEIRPGTSPHRPPTFKSKSGRTKWKRGDRVEGWYQDAWWPGTVRSGIPDEDGLIVVDYDIAPLGEGGSLRMERNELRPVHPLEKEWFGMLEPYVEREQVVVERDEVNPAVAAAVAGDGDGAPAAAGGNTGGGVAVPEGVGVDVGVDGPVVVVPSAAAVPAPVVRDVSIQCDLPQQQQQQQQQHSSVADVGEASEMRMIQANQLDRQHEQQQEVVRELIKERDTLRQLLQEKQNEVLATQVAAQTAMNQIAQQTQQLAQQAVHASRVDLENQYRQELAALQIQLGQRDLQVRELYQQQQQQHHANRQQIIAVQKQSLERGRQLQARHQQQQQSIKGTVQQVPQPQVPIPGAQQAQAQPQLAQLSNEKQTLEFEEKVRQAQALQAQRSAITGATVHPHLRPASAIMPPTQTTATAGTSYFVSPLGQFKSVSNGTARAQVGGGVSSVMPSLPIVIQSKPVQLQKNQPGVPSGN